MSPFVSTGYHKSHHTRLNPFKHVPIRIATVLVPNNESRSIFYITRKEG